MPHHYHPDDGRHYACPYCDHAPVYRRVQDNTEIETDHEFVCYQCNTGFDQPVERDDRRHDLDGPSTDASAKGGQKSGGGGATAVGEEQLRELDPDDLPL